MTTEALDISRFIDSSPYILGGKPGTTKKKQVAT